MFVKGPYWLAQRVSGVALMLLAFASTAQGGDLFGTWLSQDGEVKIEINDCPGSKNVCADIIWIDHQSDDPSALLDVENKDPQLRNRSLIGVQFLQDVERQSDNTWSGGRIYDAESGEYYAAKLKLSDERLRIMGCFGFYCEGDDWARIDP